MSLLLQSDTCDGARQKRDHQYAWKSQQHWNLNISQMEPNLALFSFCQVVLGADFYTQPDGFCAVLNYISPLYNNGNWLTFSNLWGFLPCNSLSGAGSPTTAEGIPMWPTCLSIKSFHFQHEMCDTYSQCGNSCNDSRRMSRIALV